MKRFVLCAFLMFVSAQLARSQSNPSHEETYVRTAYAKLSYATQVEVMASFAMDELALGSADDPKAFAAQMALKELTFDLSHFTVGNITDIQEIKWGDLTVPIDPAMMVLNVNLSVHTYKDNDLPETVWPQAYAKWVPVSDRLTRTEVQTVRSMPLKEVMLLGAKYWTYPDVTYTRYARFMVTAHLGGVTVGPYRALYLFGRNAKGEEVASPQDLVVPGSALFEASRQSLYPAGILHSRLRQTPAAASWLGSVANSTTGCAKATQTLCCAVAESGSQCGVSNSDLQNELSIPLPAAQASVRPLV